MTREEFAKLYGRLAVAYDTPVTPQRMSVFYDALGHIRIEALSWAISEIVKVSPKFPAISALKEQANAYRIPAKKIAYTPPQGCSAYGKEAAALIASWAEEQDNGNTVPVRERLKAMARLADKYHRQELAETVMDEWEKLPPE